MYVAILPCANLTSLLDKHYKRIRSQQALLDYGLKTLFSEVPAYPDNMAIAIEDTVI